MQIVEIALASIPPEMQNARVERVNLKVGKLTAIVVDSLNFCFDIAARETPMAGAKLVIEEVPVVARCKSCQHEWTVERPVFTCEKCDSGTVELLSGRELDIETIELADEAQP